MYCGSATDWEQLVATCRVAFLLPQWEMHACNLIRDDWCSIVSLYQGFVDEQLIPRI
jgi:hypothetical protein